jgi:hypothetical protein
MHRSCNAGCALVLIRSEEKGVPFPGSKVCRGLLQFDTCLHLPLQPSGSAGLASSPAAAADYLFLAGPEVRGCRASTRESFGRGLGIRIQGSTTERTAPSISIRCNTRPETGRSEAKAGGCGRIAASFDRKTAQAGKEGQSLPVRSYLYRIMGLLSNLVPKKGLEPPHPCEYMDLNHARLPIPPLRHDTIQRDRLDRQQPLVYKSRP